MEALNTSWSAVASKIYEAAKQEENTDGDTKESKETKKNKKIIEIVGFLACDTQANRLANTGVIQGEEASPKVVPIAKGFSKEGILSSTNFKSGPFGNWNLKNPNKLKPMIIAITATIEV